MYDKSTIAALRDLLYDLSLEGTVITNDADEEEELAERILRCVKEARADPDDACYVCGRSPAPHQTNGGPMCEEHYQAKREAEIKWDEANERTRGLGAP